MDVGGLGVGNGQLYPGGRPAWTSIVGSTHHGGLLARADRRSHPRVVSRPPRSKDLLHVTSPQVCDHTAMATLIGVVATLNTIPAADEYDTGSTVFARKPSSCESTLDVGRSRGG